SFGGFQASGSRGIGLSRVSQQDLELVRNGDPQAAFIAAEYLPLLRALHLHYSDSSDLCAVYCAQLKGDVAAGFGEALQRKLLEVEGLYSQVRSRYTFIQALVRRIRGLLRQPKS
ncbi:hypothetical protein XENOCAPTIV_008782, partial [Xenoophorus captivus]